MTSKFYPDILGILARIYVKIFKIVNLYPLIYRNDFLFNIYVIPLRAYNILKIKLRQGYPKIYIWDFFTRRYMKYRRGECKLCGKCCMDCPHLENTDDKRICKIYKRREWCDTGFPISPLDLEFVRERTNCDCGYYFDMPLKSKTTGKLKAKSITGLIS